MLLVCLRWHADMEIRKQCPHCVNMLSIKCCGPPPKFIFGWWTPAWSNDTRTNNGITPKSQELVRAGFKYPPVGVIVPSRFRWKYSLRNHQPVAVAYFWPRFEELQVSTWDSPWQSPKLGSQSNSRIHGYSMDQYGTMMYNVHPCPLFQTLPIQGQRPCLGELSYRSKRRARGGMGAKTICGDSVWWSRVKSGTPKCINSNK